MLLENKDQFVGYVPTAAAGDWRDMETFRDSAERWIEAEVLGGVLYRELDGAQEKEEYSILLDLCRKVISLDAYNRAIPFLDLIQSANGFGVVSNPNLAPASRDRVNRLIEETQRQRDDESEVLINYLEMSPSFHDSWKGSRAYSVMSDCLIQTARELSRLSTWNGTRRDFLRLRPDMILRTYSDIGRWVGRAYVDELVEQQRDGDLTEANRKVLDLLKFSLACYVAGDMRGSDGFRDEAVSLMDSAPLSYPTYAGSEEYRTRHREGTGNDPGSPIFIMGGI